MALEPTVVKLDRLQRQKEYFDKSGAATPQMQLHWQRTMEAIEQAFFDLSGTIEAVIQTQEDLAIAQAALEATQETLATAVADIAAAQAAIISVQDDVTGLQTTIVNAVLKDQTTAWATPTGTFARTTFATYAGQTISASYTQSEVQTIDDRVKAIEQRLAALISDLRGNDVLT